MKCTKCGKKIELCLEVISVQVVKSFYGDNGVQYYANEYRIRLYDNCGNEVIDCDYDIGEVEIEEFDNPFKNMINYLCKIYFSRFTAASPKN